MPRRVATAEVNQIGNGHHIQYDAALVANEYSLAILSPGYDKNGSASRSDG